MGSILSLLLQKCDNRLTISGKNNIICDKRERNMKTITVLLVKNLDWVSNILCHICGHGYTHASIGLEDNDIFYSFNFRGFCIETSEKHRRRGVKESLCFQLTVTNETYDFLQKQIQHFENNKEQYKYSKFGVFCCALRLPITRENRYFCSHFVAELLSISGAVQLRKSASLYFPNQFRRELERFSGLCNTLYNPV